MGAKDSRDTLAITEGSGNVFEDLGFQDAEKYLAKAELARQINRLIMDRGLIQAEAAGLLGVDQPKISAIARGQLSAFSIERLIGFLNKLDQDVKILVFPKMVSAQRQGCVQVALA